jgi:hypothetical protein
MIKSRGQETDQTVLGQIVATLAEKVYAHGHAVGLGEAQEIGLPVESASPELEAAMWQLLETYESDLKLPEEAAAALQGRLMAQECTQEPNKPPWLAARSARTGVELGEERRAGDGNRTRTVSLED